MFALLALLAFTLVLFRVQLGEVDLVVLGLAFIAAHLLFAVAIPWPQSMRRRG